MPLHHTAETLRAYREACQRCAEYTLNNQCSAYVNARVHRVMDSAGEVSDFTLTFAVDDWYATDSTVAHYVNGEKASNFY